MDDRNLAGPHTRMWLTLGGRSLDPARSFSPSDSGLNRKPFAEPAVIVRAGASFEEA